MRTSFTLRCVTLNTGSVGFDFDNEVIYEARDESDARPGHGSVLRHRAGEHGLHQHVRGGVHGAGRGAERREHERGRDEQRRRRRGAHGGPVRRRCRRGRAHRGGGGRDRGGADLVGLVEGPHPGDEERHHPGLGLQRPQQVRGPELQGVGAQGRLQRFERSDRHPAHLSERLGLVLVLQRQGPEDGQHLQRVAGADRADELRQRAPHGHRLVQQRQQHLLDRQQLLRQDRPQCGAHPLPDHRRLPQVRDDRRRAEVHRLPDHRLSAAQGSCSQVKSESYPNGAPILGAPNPKNYFPKLNFFITI